MSCKGGRREISNPEITGALEEDGDRAGESKLELIKAVIPQKELSTDPEPMQL